MVKSCYISIRHFSLFYSRSVPTFGEELGWQFKPGRNPAPAVLMKCTKAIEDRGLHTENIYTFTPPGPHKKALKVALNQGICIVTNVHSVLMLEGDTVVNFKSQLKEYNYVILYNVWPKIFYPHL